MKSIYSAIFLSLVFFLFSCKKDPVTSTPIDENKTYTVTVNEGYGSGTFKVGDTVQIWSRNMNATETFLAWTGDTLSIKDRNEWHSWFVMPANNVVLTATFMPVNFIMQYEKIKGAVNLKNVYYVFPANHKGIVYLFHGSNGSATYWTKNYENFSLVKDLVADGFAVIITEAEEVTLNNDTNGDGSFRWVTSTIDSTNNIDFANLKAITDTFYQRNYSNRSIPRYCIGQSNGGSCSISFGYCFKLKACVAYCASGGATGGAVSSTTTPTLFCLQGADNNSVMGLSGNANAISNSQAISRRSICSKYFVNPASPLYENRFARNTIISSSLSTQIFNEIKNNNLLTSKNYMKVYAKDLWSAVSASSSRFPVIAALSTDQKAVVDEQISCVAADHQFYSDNNKSSINFLNNQCQ